MKRREIDRPFCLKKNVSREAQQHNTMGPSTDGRYTAEKGAFFL